MRGVEGNIPSIAGLSLPLTVATARQACTPCCVAGLFSSRLSSCGWNRVGLDGCRALLGLVFGSFGASSRDHRLALVVFGSRFNLGFLCFIWFFRRG